MKKICNTCSQRLHETDFYASPNTLDGRAGDCKPCYREKRNQRWQTGRLMDALELERARLAKSRIEVEARDLGEPLSFAGLSDSYFRNQHRVRGWRVR